MVVLCGAIGPSFGDGKLTGDFHELLQRPVGRGSGAERFDQFDLYFQGAVHWQVHRFVRHENPAIKMGFENRHTPANIAFRAS